MAIIIFYIPPLIKGLNIYRYKFDIFKNSEMVNLVELTNSMFVLKQVCFVYSHFIFIWSTQDLHLKNKERKLKQIS